MCLTSVGRPQPTIWVASSIAPSTALIPSVVNVRPFCRGPIEALSRPS